MVPTLAEADPGVAAALRNLRNAEFLRTQKYQELQWRANRLGADIRIVEFERLFVRRLRLLGVPMYCHSMVRTVKQQMEVIAEGHSKIRDPERGAHVRGRASDIVHAIRHWDLRRSEWSMLGHIGKEIAKTVRWAEVVGDERKEHTGIRVIWGGDWKFYDPAHWEIEGP